MPGFSCDNSQDGFVGEEIYELVYEDIANEEKRLGRDLTIKERDKIYRDNGAPIPAEMYFGPYSDDEDEVEDSPQAATGEQAIEVTPDQTEDSSNESEISEPLSPLMERYWQGLKRISEKYGVTATLDLPKKVPSTTTKTRFIFLEKGSESKE